MENQNVQNAMKVLKVGAMSSYIAYVTNDVALATTQNQNDYVKINFGILTGEQKPPENNNDRPTRVSEYASVTYFGAQAYYWCNIPKGACVKLTGIVFDEPYVDKDRQLKSSYVFNTVFIEPTVAVKAILDFEYQRRGVSNRQQNYQQQPQQQYSPQGYVINQTAYAPNPQQAFNDFTQIVVDGDVPF